MIDLDAQATTPIAPQALAAMLPWLERQHWNPHSAHRGGRMAKAALEAARVQVAGLLGAEPGGLIFTSGATEANNLALKGMLAEREGLRRRLVTFATEHSCVLETALHLERLGLPITILAVLADGMPDLAALNAALGPDVALVSAMRVNNEIGSIWPSAELAAMAHKVGAAFHCDAAQGFGKIDCRLDGGLAGADLVSLSGHKMHGPKGIGALWLRDGVSLSPMILGGAQEQGLRAGTVSPALVAGFGAAAILARQSMDTDAAHVAHLWEIAANELADWTINGSVEHRYRGNINLRRDGINATRLLSDARTVAFSLGSACGSGSGRTSHVLRAMGIAEPAARSSIRLGWGRYTTETDLRQALAALKSAAALQDGAPPPATPPATPPVTPRRAPAETEAAAIGAAS